MKWEVIEGDCVEQMALMPEASVDAVVCDPPYGLEFMGKDWDRLGAVALKDPSEVGGFQDGNGGNAYSRSRIRFGASARQMQEWHETWALEALRVLKPGGHLLAFGGTRTYHRLTCAIEDAGFEIRDSFLYWGYGSGFPKSLSPYRSSLSALCPSTGHARRAARISEWLPVESLEAKAPTAVALAETLPEGELALLIRTGEAGGTFDRMAMSLSALAEAGISLSTDSSWRSCSAVLWDRTSMSITETARRLTTDPRILNCLRSVPTPPTTTPDECRPDGCACDAWPVAESLSGAEWKWSGTPLLIATERAIGRLSPLKPLGTAAKPAYEPIVVARKPLAGTVAQNCLEHGTGALNVDGCRIGVTDDDARAMERCNTPGSGRFSAGRVEPSALGRSRPGDPLDTSQGRWPANVVLDPQSAAMLDEQTGKMRDGVAVQRNRDGLVHNEVYGPYAKPPVADVGYGGSGGASRFFYVAKASSAERNAGLDGFEEERGGGLQGTHDQSMLTGSGNERNPFARNHHPTVKPIELMRWLVRLVTPPGGLVLDPFTGSGTTGCAAMFEKVWFVGIERDPEYIKIARARIAWWAEHPEGMELVRRLEAERERKAVADSGQLDLLGGVA